MSNRTDHPTIEHDVDVCVIGGGMAGLLAAVAAARHGAKVALMHDRPVLGGNASSECRMHICGADRHNGVPNVRETGILEELRMENLYRNPTSSYAIWDTILYEKARFEPNITLLLNTSCQAVGMDGPRISSIRGWQLTTYSHQFVRAKLFIDCSGDAVLAPLTGAEFRIGREGRDEFGEKSAPPRADRKTMGMTLLFVARQYDSPQRFIAPSWAYRFDDKDLPGGENGHRWFRSGYWWVELGGEGDSIADTEKLRDELLKIALGVWDHIKNRGEHQADNWALDWLQFLPAKRESRRYVGDHMLTQNDVEAGGNFDDVAAYGGWKMDDHDPAGFWAVRHARPATVYYATPTPYGIPYRTLYSRNIENLMFAGRCHSATHMAMSSTRVMATCAIMGQAAGTAAALATRLGIDPRDVNRHMRQLQAMLMADDCWLPPLKQDLGELTRSAQLAVSRGDGEALRDGIMRPIGQASHRWAWRKGDWAEYRLNSPRRVAQATIIADSALDRDPAISQLSGSPRMTAPPEVMPRAMRLEALVAGQWQPVATMQDSHQRLIRVPVGRELSALRLTLDETWGAEESGLYGFYIE